MLLYSYSTVNSYRNSIIERFRNWKKVTVLAMWFWQECITANDSCSLSYLLQCAVKDEQKQISISNQHIPVPNNVRIISLKSRFDACLEYEVPCCQSWILQHVFAKSIDIKYRIAENFGRDKLANCKFGDLLRICQSFIRQLLVISEKAIEARLKFAKIFFTKCNLGCYSPKFSHTKIFCYTAYIYLFTT